MSPSRWTPLVLMVLGGGGLLTSSLAGERGWALTCGLMMLIGPCLGVLSKLRRKLVTVTVRGKSMEPTYHHGERVLVRRDFTPAPGQVVVVEYPGNGGVWPDPPVGPAAEPSEIPGRRWIIKRVAATPGDPVPRDTVPALAEAGEENVPEGQMVLLGDNPDASFDSRQMGYFPLERILGTAVRRLGH
ncbi:S26 family signal peptidase [Streptosporangium sp. NPDC002721]|uniref:S26 family signal peptidase n=1 Tax=Streptosporangium sp. NPDC002721 TaxID=3366188 RepID=UPI00368C88B1